MDEYRGTQVHEVNIFTNTLSKINFTFKTGIDIPSYEILSFDEKGIVYSLEEEKKGDVPFVLIEPKYMNEVEVDLSLKALMDSGASVTCIKRSVVPNACVAHKINGCTIKGFGGTKVLKEVVELQQVTMMEFSRSYTIEKIPALIVDEDMKYDLIVGRDVLKPAGFVIDFEEGVMQWMNIKIPLKTKNG